MSIQDKIQRLQAAKDNIAEAITAKGGTVNEGDGFEEFSSDIGTISSGISVDEDYTVESGKLTSASVELGDVVATIPDGVVTIGKTAFYNNVIITKVVMPNSVTTIEDGAPWFDGASFCGCRNLKTIILSNALTNIGDYAFSECKSLTSITIPDSVTSIGEGVFNGCTSLTDIYYTSTQAEWEQITFGIDAIPASATIHYNYTPAE